MIAIVCGMRAEAALLPSETAYACCGGNVARAYDEAKRLLARGARGILSFGIAGGLDPALVPGDLVVGTAIAVGDRLRACDVTWCGSLRAALPEVRSGAIYGATNAVAYPAEKDSLFRRTKAIAVDLESAGVAQACAEASRPFAVLRAIADPASRAIPPSAQVGLTPMGRIDPLAVLRSLLGRIGDGPGLARLALDTRTALAALAGATRRLGPTLGFETLAARGDE